MRQNRANFGQMKPDDHTHPQLSDCKGGVAIEYIFVSIFALVLSAAAMQFLKSFAESRISEIAEEFNIQMPEFDLHQP